MSGIHNSMNFPGISQGIIQFESEAGMMPNYAMDIRPSMEDPVLLLRNPTNPFLCLKQQDGTFNIYWMMIRCVLGFFTIVFNAFRLRQNARHFPDDIFKCSFLNENH